MNTINVLFWTVSSILVSLCLMSIVSQTKIKLKGLKLPKGVKLPGVEVKLGLLIAVVLLFLVLKHQENFMMPLDNAASVLPGKCQGYNGLSR